MLSAEYFRRQSQICRRLSRMVTDGDVALKMQTLAEQHQLAAEEIERRSDAFIPLVAYEASSPRTGRGARGNR